MRIVLAFIPAFALMLGVSGAFAQAQPQEVSQPTSSPATTDPGTSLTDAEKRIICRPFSHEAMVIWDKRNCHTLEEWDAIRYLNRQAVEAVQRRALTMN
jgi:hypothetical protein